MMVWCTGPRVLNGMEGEGNELWGPRTCCELESGKGVSRVLCVFGVEHDTRIDGLDWRGAKMEYAGFAAGLGAEIEHSVTSLRVERSVTRLREERPGAVSRTERCGTGIWVKEASMMIGSWRLPPSTDELETWEIGGVGEGTEVEPAIVFIAWGSTRIISSSMISISSSSGSGGKVEVEGSMPALLKNG